LKRKRFEFIKHSALRSGLEIPNGLLARDVPQIIILTFDGPI
uniref:Copine domain-containing protein n=1 Tax=Brugia timori TaxID=42155 RepID=A0A0R3Q6X8_9BILA